MTTIENEQNATKCFDELRELAGDSSVPRQQLMEPRVGTASTAAKIRGWLQTTETLERGELSNSELDAIMRELFPALDESIERVKCGTKKEKKEEEELLRVMTGTRKALERRFKALGLRARTPRWP